MPAFSEVDSGHDEDFCSFNFERRKNSYDLGDLLLDFNFLQFLAIKFGEIDCGSMEFDKGFVENPINRTCWDHEPDQTYE